MLRFMVWMCAISLFPVSLRTKLLKTSANNTVLVADVSKYFKDEQKNTMLHDGA